jgi:membrane-bound lytic murein transglycosylase D
MQFGRCAFLLLFLGVIAFPIQSLGQSFYSSMEKRFSQSEHQWLVATLEAQSPMLFQKKIVLPALWDTLSHLQWGTAHWTISNEERQIFNALWCPKGNTTRLQKIVSLLDLYGPLFKKSIAQQGLDPALQWLPVLTSGVNQHYNDSLGRRGLWGLDYLTARKLGLQITEDWDDRCGGDYTTSSAAMYLHELQAKHQNGFAALLIFLHGAPQVLALPSTEYNALPRDWQLEISFLIYSDHLLRALRLDSQQHHYFDLMGLYAPIRSRDTLDTKALEACMSEDLTALKGMNPTMTSTRILPGVTKVPYFISIDNAQRFASMQDSLSRWKNTRPTPSADAPRYHKVKRGESLGSIAKKYRVGVKQLQKANQLKGSKIRPGQMLVIPTHQEPGEIEPQQDAAATPVAPVSPDATTAEKAPEKDKKSPPKEEVYVVKPGDSLWKIARKYRGVTEEDLKRWNNIGDDIRPGQKLKIRQKKK